MKEKIKAESKPAPRKSIAGQGTFYYAVPGSITRRAGWNPRFDFGEIKELEQSIVANGFYDHRPLLVRRNAVGKLELVDGDRRLTAVENLIKSKRCAFPGGIPVMLEKKGLDDFTAAVHMLTANDGKPFLPLEEAALYDRMVKEHGKTVQQIADATGRGYGTVSRTLALVTADQSLKDALKNGEISATVAKLIAKNAVGDGKLQKELVERAASGPEGKREVMKAAESGQTLRRASMTELSKREAEVVALLEAAARVAGWNKRTVRKHIAAGDGNAAAYYYGVLMGIYLAQGKNPELEV